MPKFFVEGKQVINDQIQIIGEDVNHISNVLRLKKEDEIIIGNKENGKSYQAKIMILNKDNIICEIIKQVEETTEPQVDITIYQGLPKAEKMEYIIQKATEIGAKQIVPVAMKRCIVKLNAKDEIKKRQRWQKIAEVAAKQSGRDKIPQIQEIKTIQELPLEIQQYHLFLIAYEQEKECTLKQVLTEIKKQKIQDCKIGVLIGPEGGIEEEEIQQLKENSNVKIITLGKRILRTETASLVLISNILYELEMES